MGTARPWPEPTPKQAAWLVFVKDPVPEPPPHVCGNCRNPWTGGRPDCPNARRTS